MLDELNKVHFARFRIVMEAETTLGLPPYKGSTFRGAFGHTFKKLVCVKRDLDCDTCLLRDRCVYFYVFETPSAEHKSPGRGYTFAPHPFIIEPPEDDKQRYLPGDRLEVGVVLIGQAVEQLPYFIYAFEEMGQRGLGRGRGKARLCQVWAVDREGQDRLIYGSDSASLDMEYPICHGPRKGGTDQDRLKVRFRTPTRLQANGKMVNRIDFAVLVRSLFRRVSDLARYHCDTEMDIDYRGWIEQADRIRVAQTQLRWYNWERYSNRQQQKMAMGGVVGEVCYEGETEAFAPLLRLGADLHVGKGTGFGLGRYELVGKEQMHG